MDPNACLERFFDAEHDYIMAGLNSDALTEAAQEMREAHNNLCMWLNNGGFEPDWTAHGTTKEEFLNYYKNS